MHSVQRSYAEKSGLILNGRPARIETENRIGCASHGRHAHAPWEDPRSCNFRACAHPALILIENIERIPPTMNNLRQSVSAN